MTLVPDWLRQRTLATPDRLAVVASGERLSYQTLDERVLGAAGWLRSVGVAEGDRVALLVRNGLPYVTLVHAISRVRGVVVPLNIRLAPAEVIWQLGDARAALLIYDQANAAPAEAAALALPTLRLAAVEKLTPKPGVTVSRLDLDSPHSILYTSGTTGQPKGAVLTFGNHWWSAIGSALNLGLQADDCWLAVLPLFHVGGLAILLRAVMYGNAVVVQEAFDPVLVNQAIDRDAITLVSLVATMLQRTLEARGDRPFPKSLRGVLLGGGPAPRPLLEDCVRRNLPVMQTYGLTEAASQVATLTFEESLRKLGSAGKPLLPTELRVERELGVTASPGEAGEIVVRGPTVTPGYLDRPEATAQALRDGWLHTGDLGYLDEDGYLFVLDRRDDLIISGGENVYPAEVESVLRAHPAVVEAGIVGRADERWGQAPVAFVVVRQPVSGAELIAFCNDRLAGYKVPKFFRFVEALPRNAAGKLLRRVLAEQF